MYLAKNAEVKEQVLTTVEGKQLKGEVRLKAMMAGNQMTLLEIQYAPGTGTPTHVHQHESLVYVIKGKVNPVPRTYVRGFRACPSGTSEHSSLHLRTWRSVVRGKDDCGE